jgi:YVTN family beta-propeller protein
LRKPLPARCKKPRSAPSSNLPSLGTIVATVPIPGAGGEGSSIALGAGALWFGDSNGVWRIDPQTTAVVAHIPTPADGDIVVSDSGVFVSNFETSTVTRIDPATNTVVATIALPAGAAPLGIAATSGAIWVANHHDWTVSRIDPATNAIVASIPIPGGTSGDCCGPGATVAGAGSVWVAVAHTNNLVRIDPHTNAIVATVGDEGHDCGIGALAADDTAIWTTNGSCGGDAVGRIDPGSNSPVPTSALARTLRKIATAAPGAIAAAGNLYVTIGAPKPAVVRINETTNTITGYLALPAAAFSSICNITGCGLLEALYDAGSLWVGGPGEVVRIKLAG